MEYKKITLRRGKEESLLRFHPWVFSGAIARLEEGAEEGDLVRVMSHDGRHIGDGHFQRQQCFPPCAWRRRFPARTCN